MSRKSSRTTAPVIELPIEVPDEVQKNGLDQPKKMKKNQSKDKLKSTSFRDGVWDTLYEDFILNKTDAEVVQTIVEVLVYFSEQTVDEVTATNLVDFIRKRYNQNYYHCFRHAAHVVLNTSHFLLNIQPQVAHYFTRIEKFAMVYAALIHDVEHLGVTNHELVVKKHPLAILYNDQSVAEMNSLAVGLDVLNQPKTKLLKNWNEEEFRKFRHFVIDLVLATDIADPFKKRIATIRFQESFVNNDNVPSANAIVTAPSAENNPFPVTSGTPHSSHHHHRPHVFDIINENCRLAFLLITLRAADISATMQSVATWRIWAKNYFDENRYAALTNTGPNMEINSYYKSQIGYMDGHVKVLIEKLKSANIINETFTNILLLNVVANIETWRENGMQMYQDWSESEECKKYTKEVEEAKKNSEEKGKRITKNKRTVNFGEDQSSQDQGANEKKKRARVESRDEAESNTPSEEKEVKEKRSIKKKKA